LAASAEAERLDAKAAAASERAKEANQHADNYMLAVVLFAASLFFFGLSAKLQILKVRAAMLGVGCVVLLGTVTWLATLPAQLTT